MNKIQLTTTAIIAISIFATLIFTSCSTAKKVIIPVDNKQVFEDTYTIIWNGYSKAFVYKNDSWLRAESFDYYFDVIQKRYDKQWKSVKSLHRIHPDYNGKAGKRDQTMYFGVDYKTLQGNVVNGTITSSLGYGTLITDNEYRNSNIDIDLKNASMFIPYNKIRITQKYDYENGKLTETVLLLKVKGDKETPFMKNEEEAFFYIKGKLDKAPSKFESKK
jgi:hypothetical protein